MRKGVCRKIFLLQKLWWKSFRQTFFMQGCDTYHKNRPVSKQGTQLAQETSLYHAKSSQTAALNFVPRSNSFANIPKLVAPGENTTMASSARVAIFCLREESSSSRDVLGKSVCIPFLLRSPGPTIRESHDETRTDEPRRQLPAGGGRDPRRHLRQHPEGRRIPQLHQQRRQPARHERADLRQQEKILRVLPHPGDEDRRIRRRAGLCRHGRDHLHREIPAGPPV